MRKFEYKRGTKRKLTEEEITEFKDFSRVRANYQKALSDIHRKPIHKNPKLFVGILMIILIAYIIFELVEKQEKERQNAPAEQPVSK